MLKHFIGALAIVGLTSGAVLAQEVEIDDDDGILEETGEAVGETVEETGEAVGDVAEGTGDAVEEATDDDDEIEVEIED